MHIYCLILYFAYYFAYLLTAWVSPSPPESGPRPETRPCWQDISGNTQYTRLFPSNVATMLLPRFWPGSGFTGKLFRYWMPGIRTPYSYIPVCSHFNDDPSHHDHPEGHHAVRGRRMPRPGSGKLAPERPRPVGKGIDRPVVKGIEVSGASFTAGERAS